MQRYVYPETWPLWRMCVEAQYLGSESNFLWVPGERTEFVSSTLKHFLVISALNACPGGTNSLCTFSLVSKMAMSIDITICICSLKHSFHEARSVWDSELFLYVSLAVITRFKILETLITLSNNLHENDSRFSFCPSVTILGTGLSQIFRIWSYQFSGTLHKTKLDLNFLFFTFR